ncbi:hypothetical protein CC2G_009962 [Coprinopsis cinerea AmutBmut pab1-1]|nr:hypothetical protein CC2G_009962 [Coprinopsis cinerea AmutBmut pab1-1]
MRENLCNAGTWGQRLFRNGIRAQENPGATTLTFSIDDPHDQGEPEEYSSQPRPSASQSLASSRVPSRHTSRVHTPASAVSEGYSRPITAAGSSTTFADTPQVPNGSVQMYRQTDNQSSASLHLGGVQAHPVAESSIIRAPQPSIPHNPYPLAMEPLNISVSNPHPGEFDIMGIFTQAHQPQTSTASPASSLASSPHSGSASHPDMGSPSAYPFPISPSEAHGTQLHVSMAGYSSEQWSSTNSSPSSDSHEASFQAQDYPNPRLSNWPLTSGNGPVGNNYHLQPSTAIGMPTSYSSVRTQPSGWDLQAGFQSTNHAGVPWGYYPPEDTHNYDA